MAFNLPDLHTEDLLMARIQRGDRSAVTEIYDFYFPSVYQYVRLQVGEQQTAEDITSEVFFRLMATLGKHSGPRSSLRGWLFQVARNLVYRHYGRQKQFPRSTLEEWLSADADVEMQALRTVELEKAQRALGMLAPDQREVLILRFVEALDLEETATLMGKSVSAIKSLQFRAVRTLRSILGGLAEELT